MDSMSISAIDDSANKLHIVMFPWLAFGHMMPYLQLAKLIAQKGHRISFISTPRNIDRLPKNLPPFLDQQITFVKLPLPHTQNLHENAEATMDLPYHEVKYLKIAFDGLREPITLFLRSSKPDWILYDFAPFWLPEIARNLGISGAYFSVFTASCLTFFGPSPELLEDKDKRTKPEHFTVSPNWVPFPSPVAFRLFEILKLLAGGRNDDDNVSDRYPFDQVVNGCDIIAVRSCNEFEPEWLQILEKLHRKPIFRVGQLPPPKNDVKEENEEWVLMKQWLDMQEKGTVVYVAFGSEAKPSQDELTEIALGVELSKLPFFWVLRTRRGDSDTELVKLPDGFEERIKGRGMVCTSWVPQLGILSHDSVGGFLTHSGWSLVAEAIQFERALILLTFLADQGLNARVLEEKKMGYSIPRNELDGSFTRNSVAESLRLVMVEEEGKIYRYKVKEMKGLFGNRDIQNRYLDTFLGYLQNHKRRVQLET